MYRLYRNSVKLSVLPLSRTGANVLTPVLSETCQLRYGESPPCSCVFVPTLYGGAFPHALPIYTPAFNK